MKILPIQTLILMLVWALFSTSPANAADNQFASVRIGYFQNWPLPSQFSRVKRTYDSIMGVSVYWVPFESDRGMVDALESGEIQIAYSLGLAPFVGALGRDAEVSMVGVAVTFPDHYPCVLREDSGMTLETITQLEGQTVAVQSGGIAPAKMLTVLEQLGVDTGELKTLSMQDADEMILALQTGEVVMVCADAAILGQVKAHGRPLQDVIESSSAKPILFDAIVVSDAFMRDHADLLQAFMDITEATNAQWRDNPDPMRAAITRAAAMDPVSVENTMTGFGFPSASEQKSDAWLEGSVGSEVRSLAEFLQQQGVLEMALDDYAPFISTRFLR